MALAWGWVEQVRRVRRVIAERLRCGGECQKYPRQLSWQKGSDVAQVAPRCDRESAMMRFTTWKMLQTKSSVKVQMDIEKRRKVKRKMIEGSVPWRALVRAVPPSWCSQCFSERCSACQPCLAAPQSSTMLSKASSAPLCLRCSSNLPLAKLFFWQLLLLHVAQHFWQPPFFCVCGYLYRLTLFVVCCDNVRPGTSQLGKPYCQVFFFCFFFTELAQRPKPAL